MKTKEEILREHVTKDCIWEDMQNLTNTPMRDVFTAMQEFANQERQALKEKLTKKIEASKLSGLSKATVYALITQL